MTKKTLIEFYNDEYKQQAANKNYQSIASLVDGLKPTARKVLHTVNKANITAFTKVEGTANKTAGETEYLGGANNIAGVIVNMTKNYTGSNNFPLLDKKGNFGKRLNTKAAEARYIFVRKGPNFNAVIKKNDSPILIEQEFEGTIIEPKFFVPILPMLLINGSEGMGSGHAQDIQPRKVEEVKSALVRYLKDGVIEVPAPHWNGFTGKVEQGDSDRQWITYGKYTLNRRTIVINELPIGESLKSYVKKLDKLEEKHIIRGYTDKSDTKKDIFLFEVKVDTKFSLEEDNIINKLGLSKKFSENYTSINENNEVVPFKDIKVLFKSFCDIRLDYFQKRKDYQISKLKQDLLIQASKYLFVKGITEGTIVINNKKKAEIIKQIEPIERIIKDEGSYDYLLRMPIYNITKEKVAEIKEKIVATKKELMEAMQKDITETWLEEINQI